MCVGQTRFEMHSDAVVSNPLLPARCKIAQKDQYESIKHEERKKQEPYDNVGFSSVHHDLRILNADHFPSIGTVCLEIR